MFFSAAAVAVGVATVAVAQRFGHLSGEIYLNVVSKLQLVEAG